MKKVIALFVVLFMLGLTSQAQTTSAQNKIKSKKLSTKQKVIEAVHSQKAKTAEYKAKQAARKEGE